MSVSGKKTVVVGGSSGIGLAVAKRLNAEGAQVVISSRSLRTIEEIDLLLPRAAAYEIDLTDESKVQGFFERVGAFDHLVFTAGDPLLVSPLHGISLEAAQAFFAIRYFGALLCVKHASNSIRPGGSITLSSGMSGRRPKKDWTVVSSVCGAIESFGKALAVELAPLRVNVVCPGLVMTPLWDSKPADQVASMYERAKQVLLVQHAAHPDELAEAYLFLMNSTFSTGSVTVVDGGASLASS